MCCMCGRRLRKSAATIPAVDTGPTPHPAGAVGPTCARKAGLLPVSPFTRRRVVTRRQRARRDAGQMDLGA